jgi:hypothetical protein
LIIVDPLVSVRALCPVAPLSRARRYQGTPDRRCSKSISLISLPSAGWMPSITEFTFLDATGRPDTGDHRATLRGEGDPR